LRENNTSEMRVKGDPTITMPVNNTVGDEVGDVGETITKRFSEIMNSEELRNPIS